MARLGISIYPEYFIEEQDIAYIRKASKLGYKKIFTRLLSVGEKSGEEATGQLRRLTDEAHACSTEIVPNVSPFVFPRLGTPYGDLPVFREVYVDGIRLDEGFDGMKESLMTYNPQGLKLELNVSTELAYVENTMDHHLDRGKLIICHNFHPQAYTGLSLKYFNRYNNKMKPLGLKAAASASNNAPGVYGSWPLNEGLYTLEMHRGFPLDPQVRHMSATGMVDDVLITNAYAADEELHACVAANPSIPTFGIELEKEPTDTEKQILDYEPKYVVRGDMSEYMIRSTWPRVASADQSIPAGNTRDLRPGDVVILNNGYLKYKGEPHIVIRDIPNDGCKDVTGYLPEYEHVLLDYIESWEVFIFCIV